MKQAQRIYQSSWGMVCVGAMVLGGLSAWAGFPSPSPTEGSPSPLMSASPAPNKKLLLKEFLKAQASEFRAVQHRLQFEAKELKASQEVREREWTKNEKGARHQFFDAHEQGSERRTYIRDFIQRRDEMYRHFADERKQRKLDQESRLSTLKAEQTKKLEDFKKSLNEGQVPLQSLWPMAGN